MKRKPTEEELVEGCVKNDRYSQELLYRRFFPQVMSMCLRYTRDREVALEIINRGFLRVFKKIHTFQGKGSLEGWVKKLVFHALADYFRKQPKRHKVVFLDKHDKQVGEEALQKMYVEDLMLLVDELPPMSQRVFRLFAIEGYTHREIAKHLEISEGTSKWHLSNARKKLKKLIRQNFGWKLYAG